MFHRCLSGERSVLCLVLLSSLTLGCGSSDSGYRVSGKVSFKGSPVPSGKIYFLPDSAKGNSGSAGFADIRDGQYDTSSAGGRGAPGGAVVIALEGIDPAAPASSDSPDVTTKVLFARYEVAADMPQQASTKDIEVPDSAEKGPVQPPPVPTIITP